VIECEILDIEDEDDMTDYEVWTNYNLESAISYFFK
jgi:hypothetical protein